MRWLGPSLANLRSLRQEIFVALTFRAASETAGLKPSATKAQVARGGPMLQGSDGETSLLQRPPFCSGERSLSRASRGSPKASGDETSPLQRASRAAMNLSREQFRELLGEGNFAAVMRTMTDDSNFYIASYDNAYTSVAAYAGKNVIQAESGNLGLAAWQPGLDIEMYADLFQMFLYDGSGSLNLLNH